MPAEMDHSASLKEGEGDRPDEGTADEGTTSNKTNRSHGNPSISNDMASAVPLCNVTIRIKVEQPDDVSKVAAAEPSPVNPHQSWNPSSCGYQQGQLIESAHQPLNVNMYGCSQSSQEEDDGVRYMYPGCNADGVIQNHTTHLWGLGQMPETYTFQRSQELQMSTNAGAMKRKRLHMDAQDCITHAQTEQGSVALKNPATIKTSSKDVNRGLYPRPPKSSQRGAVPTCTCTSLPTSFSPNKKKRNKFQLNPEEMKKQSRIDKFFPVSPGKKAVTDNSLDNRTAHPSPQPAAAASSFHATHTSSSSFISPKNLNSQFASMGPAKAPELQVFNRSITTSDSYQAVTPENNVQMAPSHPSCHVYTPRTPTKVYPNQNHAKFSHSDGQSSLSTQRPVPIPVKSVDDTCRDGVNESSLSTSRPSTSSFVQPSLPSSQERTPPKPAKSPSPAKSEISTVESDIDNFNNDTSLDDFDPTIMPMASSQGSTVDSDIEAFDKDSYFDNIDPEMLSAECPSVPSLPSSQSANNPPNTFGLLGEGSSPGCSNSDDEPSVQGFDRLPIEVLLRIFCFVPMMDLYQHLSCVCKLWYQIISKEEVSRK